MKEQTQREDRDEVLYAFHQAYTRPSADEIAAWTHRYPEFAEDIVAHAAVAWDWASDETHEAKELDESILARGYSQALNIIFNAEQAAEGTRSVGESQKTFAGMLSAAGKDIPNLARELNVGRTVLADLFNGWMLAPVSGRLLEAVVKALAITRESFDWALNYALQKPYLGHAKADSTPVVKPRSCTEIIRESSMSEERKRHWLDEEQ
jgi:hypothetical protein